MARKCWDAAKHLLMATPDGELVRVGGQVVEAYDWQLKKCPGRFFAIKKGEREYGPYKVDAKEDGMENTLLNRAFKQFKQDMGWEQHPRYKSRFCSRDGKMSGANYAKYCDALKVECGLEKPANKHKTGDIDDTSGAGAAKKHKTGNDSDIDAAALDRWLGVAPGASGAVFDDGAGDSSLGAEDASLDLDSQALLDGFDPGDVENWDLDALFPAVEASAQSE